MLSPRLARAYGAHADAPKKRITPAPMPKRHRSSLPLHCAFRRVDHAPPIHRAVLRWMKRRHPPFVLREGKDAARSLPALSPGPSPMNGRGERFRRVDHAPSIHRSVLRWMKKRHPPFVLREGKDAARSLPALSPGPSPMNGRGERFRRVNYDPPIHRSTDPPIGVAVAEVSRVAPRFPAPRPVRAGRFPRPGRGRRRPPPPAGSGRCARRRRDR